MLRVSNFLSLPSDPAVSQQRPCDSDYLPLSRGDSGFFQPDGFASFAGQTKKGLHRGGLFICALYAALYVINCYYKLSIIGQREY